MRNAINGFLNHLASADRAENTLDAYRADLDQCYHVLSTRLGHPAQLGDLNQENIEIYRSWLESQGYKPATISRKQAALRSFLGFVAEEYQAQTEGIVENLRPPKVTRPLPRVLTQAELDRLLSAPYKSRSSQRYRDAAILALLYETGMRVSDLAELQVDHLDRVRGQVYLSETGRWLPLKRSLDPLTTYVEEIRPHQLKGSQEKGLFLNQRGQTLSRQGIWLVVKRWSRASQLGDDVSPQSLRHTLISHLANRGISQRDIKELLGLSSINSIRFHFID